MYYKMILDKIDEIADGGSGGDIDPAVIEQAVSDWLTAHPEATTTVTDGSITYNKLDTNLKGKADAVSSLSDEIDDVGSDVTDLKSALNDSGLFPEPLPLTAGYYDLSTGVANTNPGYLHTEIFYSTDYTKIIGVSEMTANADFCSLFMDDTYVGYVYTKDGRYINPSQQQVSAGIQYNRIGVCIQGTTRGITIAIPPTYSVPELFSQFNDLSVSVEATKTENGMVGVPLEWVSGYYSLSTGEATAGTSYKRTQIINNNDFGNIIDADSVLPSSSAHFIPLWKGTTYVGYYKPSTNQYILPSQSTYSGLIKYDKFAICLSSSVSSSGVSIKPVFNGIVEQKKVYDIENPFNALKAGFLGDSITYGAGASNRFTTSYVGRMVPDFDEVINYGISSTLISGSSANAFVNRYTQMSDDLDVVFVLGGTNDYYYDAPMGEKTDNVNTTFYGALNILMSGLNTKYVGKTVAFMTPMNSYYLNHSSDQANAQGKTLKDYRDAIIDRCQYYAIPCLDLFSMCGMDVGHNEAHRTYYSSDGVHPNDNGYSQMHRLIIGFLRTIK